MDSITKDFTHADNSASLKFMATDYNISCLANKIVADKNAQKGIFNLKQIAKANDIASA